jgi:hypothetical protein
MEARNPEVLQPEQAVPLQWYTLKKKHTNPRFWLELSQRYPGQADRTEGTPKQIRDLFHHRGSESVSHALLAIKHHRMIATVVWTPNSVERSATA